MALAALVPALAFAQDQTAVDQSAADPEGSTQIQSSQAPAVDRSAADQGLPRDEIVVTGTILRGAAPVGSNLISVGEDRLQSQGAATSNELLATIPQVSNLFNTVPATQLSIAANNVQVVRPDLRNLGNSASSSSSTLVLFDGHRIASVGITQNAVDPDVLPPGAIERVEVVTDGGSATYGSDAVGGVINFITRKRFDGLKVDARYGFADDYDAFDANVTAGKDWGSGSLFASYGYQRNDPLFGRDRDYIRRVDWSTPARTPLGRFCSPGNVQISSGAAAGFYPLPSLNSALGPNTCDETDDQSIVPRTERHGALVGLHQELADWLTVDMKGFYGQRKSRTISPMRGSVSLSGVTSPGFPAFGVPPSSRQAFYRPVAGDPTATQTVYYTFGPVLGEDSGGSGVDFQEWGANAEFIARLTDNWQLRTLFNYSRSNSEYFTRGANTAYINAAANATNRAAAVNFYDPAATPNLEFVRAIANNYGNAGQAKDDLFDARAILDGALFTMPGGEVKLAAGYEFLQDSFQQRTAVDIVPGTLSAVPYTPYSRRVHSAFGEVQVPLVGADNRMGWIYSLTLAASVRYDHFSDFGSTTNPKFGVTLKPVSWIGLRGNYSTSFNAPAAVEQLGAQTNRATSFPFAFFIRPGDEAQVNFFNRGMVSLMGATPDLRPQTAATWSVGIDLDPPFLAGFKGSINYYNVKFKNILDVPTPDVGIFTNFPANIATNVAGFSRAEVEAFASRAPGGVAAVQDILNSGLPIYSLVDFRRGNYGNVKVSGLDFALSYHMPTSFGGFDASLSGNYTLNRKSQVAEGSPTVDLLEFDASRLRLQALVGVDLGAFRAQATLNHSSGYGLRPNPQRFQEKVRAFDTVNLFFKYEVPGESLFLKDLSFTLNVNNVFDTDPPIYRSVEGNANGYTNGFTLARLVQVGVAKKF